MNSQCYRIDEIGAMGNVRIIDLFVVDICAINPSKT